MSKEKESMKDIALKMRSQLTGISQPVDDKSSEKSSRGKASPKKTSPKTSEAPGASYSDNVGQGPIEQPVNRATPTKGAKSMEGLLRYFESINEKEEFEPSGIVYIDPELHAILQSLKQHGGVKIYKLVSHLVEQFVDENKRSIADLIYKKKSKYLS